VRSKGITKESESNNETHECIPEILDFVQINIVVLVFVFLYLHGPEFVIYEYEHPDAYKAKGDTEHIKVPGDKKSIK
jgi:hypothetical protein